MSTAQIELMKLYVDDIRNAPDETWQVARTVTAAIRAIALFPCTEISLDHDISHQVVLGKLSRPYPCEETFEAVAHFIAAKYRNEFDVPKITLHTSNPIGADKMRSVLADANIKCEIKLTGAANRLEMEV